MKYLITGNTGFVGSWMALMLHTQGHSVSGISLDPVSGGIFEKARISELLEFDIRADLRDADAVKQAVETVKPDVIVHLAAQRLVRLSYKEPQLTYDVNVMGTVNVLEAVAEYNAVNTDSPVRCVEIATTDKVYQNNGQTEGFQEGDALGSSDPMSTSKACADLIAQSYTYRNDVDVPVVIVRLANLLGGGDVAAEALIVDTVAAFREDRSVELRMPDAIRPWQHVLDCVSGCLALAEAVVNGKFRGEAFNLGADAAQLVTVGEVVTKLCDLWGAPMWKFTGEANAPREEKVLTLNSSKSKEELGWRNSLSLDETLKLLVDWEKSVFEGADAREVSLKQIESFFYPYSL